MYRLTLTAEERAAFDWVGDRYATGADWASLLCFECDRDDAESEWDSDDTLTFLVPESVAWELKELADSEDGRFPCFGPELEAKLEEFLSRIV